MELKDLSKEREFMKEFIKYEVNGLKEIIDGNKSALMHNEGKLVIMAEVYKELDLTPFELDVLEEHMNCLKQINTETENQNNRLQTLIGVYKKYTDSLNCSLKLSK